jgi:hypothetical protein
MTTFCNECGRYQGHESTCSKSDQVTIDDLSQENSLIRARNMRLEAERVELITVLLTIVDNDFSYGPEVGDVRSRFRSDAMKIIRTAREIIEKHTGSAT